MNRVSEIYTIAKELDEMSSSLDLTFLKRLYNAAEEVGQSWSGSCLGYHSRIYYKDLQPVPPGARFSKEWGFMETISFGETIGEWVEYDFDFVYKEIHDLAGNPNLDQISDLSKQAITCFEESQSHLLSILSTMIQEHKTDIFLKDIVNSIKEKKILSAKDFFKGSIPTGQQMSRDMNAVQAGIHCPPHISVQAKVGSLRSPFICCEDLSKLAKRAALHIENIKRNDQTEKRSGTKIFIGHGGSHIWSELKDFIQERLNLPWDEFNRVPVAGVTNIERISEMLDEAVFAFLIMTAEDEQADGNIHARMNVIHEAGLFQGRLGFKKAIILLEEDCEEFSNIHGLGQLPFPKGKIKAVFEDIRRVLEREGLLKE